MTILTKLKQRTAQAPVPQRVSGQWRTIQMCLDQDTGEYLNVGVVFSYQDRVEVRMIDTFDRVKCLYGDNLDVKNLSHYLHDVEEFIYSSRLQLPSEISGNVRLGPSMFASGETSEAVVCSFFEDVVTLGRPKGTGKSHAFRYTSTPKLRDSLFQIMRQRMALAADAIIQEDRFLLRLKNNRTVDVDAPLLSSNAVGSVVSVWYKSPIVAEKNILQASSDLTIVTSNSERQGCLSILVPTEKSGMDSVEFRRVSDVVEKQLGRLERSGVEILRAPSTDELALQTINWWSRRVS